MTDEIKKLKIEIKELRLKIKGLENDLDRLYEIDNAKLARAVHEIQEYLKKNTDFYCLNEIYAPTKVGMY